MDKVIKNLNVRPMLDRAEFEKLETPKNGENVNIRVGDTITVENVKDDVVKVSIARSVVSNPEYIFKIYVEMSCEVLIDRQSFDALADVEDYFKKSPISRILTSHIATLICNLTQHSAIGPMITVPVYQG